MPNDRPNPLDNFRKSPLFFRAVNNHPLQRNTSREGFHGAETLTDYFRNSGSHSLTWLFLNHPNSSAFDRVTKEMPIDMILRHMVVLSRPVYTDYIETNREPNFLKISADFYRELFWTESLYISYNFFNNPDNYIIEEGSEEPEELEALREIGGFDLWIKLTNNDLDKDLGFMHIKTGITVEIPEWRTKIVKCMWCGDKISNFENWFEFAVSYLATRKKIDNFSQLLIKRVKLEASGENTSEAVDDIEAKLTTTESFITIKPEHNADIVAVEYANGQDLQSLFETSFKCLDRQAAELGRVANTNPKGERMTSGENYKDISAVANRQKSTLEQLWLFAHKVKEFWGLELNFAVSGIPEKEMVPMENPPAPHPNTENSPAGMAGGSEGGGHH